MISILIKRGYLETESHIGRIACEIMAETGDDNSAYQGMLKIARQPPEDREEIRDRFFLMVLRRNQSCQHVLRVLPSGTVIINFCFSHSRLWYFVTLALTD